MRTVIIGGTGRIGSRIVTRLRERGHEAVPASPDTGVDTITGEGLADALAGAEVVIDVSNSPSLDGHAALAFFSASTSNLLSAEKAAGVEHHVALSVVGTERLVESGYFQAKLIQESLIERSSIPYTIVHATQFYEFVWAIADSATEGDTVRLPPVLIRPMAADDVASAVVEASLGAPANGIVEVAGPDEFRLDDLVRRALRERGDPRDVTADPGARYYGIAVEERTLLPAADAELRTIRFGDWLREAAPAGSATHGAGSARGGAPAGR